ncbi:MAG: glycosyltransferase family 2 protein [Candidatus Helarchaeota archaeon]
MVVDEIKTGQRRQELSSTSRTNHLPIQLIIGTKNGAIPPIISVIMPAFNEERAVGGLIDRTKRVLDKITDSYEIIVIDDGSCDSTFNICCKKCVTIIHNQHNWGKGYALREGFRHARGEIIVTIDSDGEHHPEEIPLLVQPIIDGKTEVTLGTRFRNNGNKLVTSVTNTFGNKFFNFVIHWLTNCVFTDTQCGFRAFKKDSLQRLDLQAYGYDIETEMIVKLARYNIPYLEIPVRSPVSTIRKSNLNWVKDGLRILYTIFKIRLKNLQ